MENTKIIGGKWQLNRSQKMGDGCVYRGKNISTNNEVAIKELATPSEHRDEVLGELSALKECTDKNYPNLVKVLDYVA